MTQFIMEAIVLCEVGGVMGWLLGVMGGDIGGALMELPPGDSSGLGVHRFVDLLVSRHHFRHLSRLESGQSGSDRIFALRVVRTHLINRGSSRCKEFGDAARREEGEYWLKSSTDEQHSRIAKELQPSGLERAGRLASLLLGRVGITAMLPRCASPSIQPAPARTIPIYEMGSSSKTRFDHAAVHAQCGSVGR